MVNKLATVPKLLPLEMFPVVAFVKPTVEAAALALAVPKCQ